MSIIRRQEIRRSLRLLELRRKDIVQPLMAELGLAAGQPGILDRLLERREGMTQRELADACGLDATTISRALDRLEGLVAREPSEESRRSNRIVLTPEGVKLAQKVSNGLSTMDDSLCWGFTDEELEALLGYLRRMEENLGGKGAP